MFYEVTDTGIKLLINKFEPPVDIEKTEPQRRN